jgi:hypothetical protein
VALVLRPSYAHGLITASTVHAYKQMKHEKLGNLKFCLNLGCPDVICLLEMQPFVKDALLFINRFKMYLMPYRMIMYVTFLRFSASVHLCKPLSDENCFVYVLLLYE